MNAVTKILRRQNNELDKKLTSQNNEIMTDMICYLRVANIAEYYQEIVRQDLLHMVLSAQERSEDIKTVIGEDYKTFCDEVISALPQQGRKEKILDSLDAVLQCIVFLGVIDIAFFILDSLVKAATGQPLHYQIPLSAGKIISILLITGASLFIVNFIGKKSFDIKPARNKVKYFIVAWVGGCVIIGVFLLILWLGRQPLFTVNVFVLCIFLLLLYAIHSISRYAVSKQNQNPCK